MDLSYFAMREKNIIMAYTYPIYQIKEFASLIKKKIVLSFVFQHSQNHVASKQNDFKTFERMNIGKHGSEL